MPSRLPILYVLTYAQKRAVLERHGYTLHEDDAEEDLDFTLTGDVAAGQIALAELEAAVGS
ncbi:hypothetical protein [Pseudoxanthomonas composti]|uniref:Uncharacterized protein n=1 Tax=Pseudoxanthomonas composti TaxID=2137479 RepID=A0A4Q1JU87_9GAMM|nr:hypothetical protein [Pseudoxanthomonas composti]RXR05247.1 hypothetical protein EPA99_10890 [Pseudoxanthomonas composti]